MSSMDHVDRLSTAIVELHSSALRELLFAYTPFPDLVIDILEQYCRVCKYCVGRGHSKHLDYKKCSQCNYATPDTCLQKDRLSPESVRELKKLADKHPSVIFTYSEKILCSHCYWIFKPKEDQWLNVECM